MFVHGDNINQKEADTRKYGDPTSKKYLAEIRAKYDAWKNANLALVGPTKVASADDEQIIAERVRLFNEYKDFLDQKVYAEHFDSRSNLHSSALEEFIYYLFKDLVSSISPNALIGKSHAFKDIFFRSVSFMDMVQNPNVEIEKKDHDFVIGVNLETSFNCSGYKKKLDEVLEIPAIAIECKTYLDKTMLEGSSTAGAQLKMKNPNAIYIVVAERLKLTEAVNLKKYSVDQIYVLRKEKNKDREFRLEPGFKTNPIFADVVWHLFKFVRDYLTADWHGSIEDGITKGYLI